MNEFSEEELKIMIKRMSQIKDGFYFQAVQTHSHPFVEFAGMMSKYIELCEELKTPFLPAKKVPAHNLEYLAEKIGCVFGDLLSNKSNRDAFVKHLFKDEKQ